MSNKCGHVARYSGAEYCSESCSLDAHDREHTDDPTVYWGECTVCADRVDADIEAGTRCAKHGISVGECGPCEAGMQMAIDRANDCDAFPNK